MKRFILLILLLSVSVSFADETRKPNPSKSIVKENKENKEFSKRNVNASDLEALEFSADTIFKNITFNAVENIDFINIYDENNQQIFSAKGSIIVKDTLNISFLEKGTYYVEVVVGKTMGAQKIKL